MKILYLTAHTMSIGGTHVILSDLANHLCQNHDVVVAGGGDGIFWTLLDEKVKKVKFKNFGRSLSLVKDFKTFFELRKLYRKEKPDIIHLFNAKGLVIGSLAFPANNIIWSMNGFDTLRKKYRKFLFILKLLKNRSCGIFVESNYDLHNMMKEGFTKIHLVRNGVDPPQFIPNVSINGIEKYDKVIMSIARISPQKRFESFVEIAGLLPQFAFVWIGADKDYCDLPANLFLLKGEPNAKRYLQLADIFVIPTNYEGMPLAIAEAFSYGKPVIASDVGAISEIVQNGQNGFVLENDNQLFVEKIQYILDNQDIYNAFSKKALEVFQSKLTKQGAIKGYINVYNTVFKHLPQSYSYSSCI